MKPRLSSFAIAVAAPCLIILLVAATQPNFYVGKFAGDGTGLTNVTVVSTPSTNITDLGYDTSIRNLTVLTNLAGNGVGLTNLNVLARGVATLSGGSNVVACAVVAATNDVILTYTSNDGTLDTFGEDKFHRTNGVSFTIICGSATDTNDVTWAVIRP